jgi:hypothetical protein
LENGVEAVREAVLGNKSDVAFEGKSNRVE